MARRTAAVHVLDLLEPRGELDEPASRQEVVDRLVLRHVADPPVDAGVPPHRLAEHRDRSLRRLRQPADRTQQRRLAGSVRAEQGRDARLDDERDVAHRHDAREPLRDAVDDDRGLGGLAHPRTSRFVRRTSHAASTTVRPRSQSERDAARHGAVELVAEDPVDAVDERLREAHERERVGAASREVVLRDPADRRPDEEHGQHRHRRVGSADRERRHEQRQGREHRRDDRPGGDEPGDDVPVVGEERPRLLRIEGVPREEHRLGRPRGAERDGAERRPAGAHVVERCDRPGGVEREHPVAPVGADQQRCDDRGEQPERHHRPLVVVAVRRKLEVVGVRGRPDEGGDHDEDDHRDEREPEQEPRRDLRPDPAPEPERDADPVAPDRAPPRPASGPFSLVAVVAEVEDLGGPGRHGAASASRTSAGAAVSAVSTVKTSASECRAGASR